MDAALLGDARRIGLLRGCHVQMTIPSVLASGERFSLRLSAVGPDALPLETFDHEIVFEGSVGIEGLPRSFRFETGTHCIAEIPGLRAVGPDLAQVRARVEGTAYLGSDPVLTSNPAWVRDDPAWRIYWGDLHVHTTYSNCWTWSCREPAFCYAYAREVGHLDFAAAADHLRGIASDAARWPALQQIARDGDDPGRFVPFLAFESSHAKGYGGDNNAYYRDLDGPYFWVDRDDMRGIAPKVPLEDLWAFLDATGCAYMTAPHHTGRRTKNRTFDEPRYDAAREPLFEIFSGWGSSELRHSRHPIAGGNAEDAAYYVDALRAGCRFGVIASSDDHATLPGRQQNHRTDPLGRSSAEGNALKGLAAVRASDLTREALWEAMTTRRTYATTLARTLVDVRLGDLSMGEEVTIPAGDPLRKRRDVTVEVIPDLGRERGTRVELLRNGETIATGTIPEGETTVTLEDAVDIESVATREAAFHPEPFVAYYVRILAGHTVEQWTSPIWLDL